MTLTQHQDRRQAPASRITARPARLAPSTGRWVALVVVLAGLFGMHGLAGHGTHGTEQGMDASMVVKTAGATGMAAMAGHDADAAHSLRSLVGPLAHQATHDLPGAVSGDGGAVTGAVSGGAMSALCLAVLTAGALLLQLAARRRRVALAQLPTPARSTVVVFGRDRDPPTLTALSIRRC